MKHFKIKQDGFKEIKNAILIKTIPMVLIAGIGGLLISHFNGAGHQSNYTTYLFVVPIVLCSMAFGLFRSIKSQRKIFESYTLTISDNEIIREQFNTPTIAIKFSEINEIIKNSNNSFTIKGNTTNNLIGIPSQIEGYESLEIILNNIKPINTRTTVPILQKYSLLIVFLVIGLMAIVYISKNKLFVGVGGVILLVGMGYSLFVSQRSKNIDGKTKKLMWMVILVAISIIGTMYFKLIGK